MAEIFQVKFRKLYDDKEEVGWVPEEPDDTEYPPGVSLGVLQAFVRIYQQNAGGNKGVVLVYNSSTDEENCYELQNNDHFWMIPRTSGSDTTWVPAKNQNHELDPPNQCSPIGEPNYMAISEGSQTICFGTRCYTIR